MARFTNQAQLNYNGITRNSNVAVGEITESLTAAKEALRGTYTSGDTVTYILSYVNSSSAPLTGITIPAGGNAVIVYEVTVNEFTPLTVNSAITNTATASAGTVTPAVTATETITVQTAADLSITKSISPIPVSDNETLTYTFTIQNYGNTAASAEDSVALSDTFNPILSDISVSLNGTALTSPAEYSYNEATGVFNTVAGRITVPAATFTQDPTTGLVTVTPGVTTVVISGTV